MPRSALACALAAGLLAALGVAEQRVGLALAVCLLLLVAAAATGARRRPPLLVLALAIGLAVQPAVLDAGWVVVIDVVATAVAAALLATGARDWPALEHAARAPWRLVGVARAAWAGSPRPDDRHIPSIARGVTLAVVLVAAFGGLFALADSAFKDAAGDVVALDWHDAWRIGLGLTVAGVGGALARAGRPRTTRTPRVHGHLESLIALGALVALFAAFVGIELRTLFGGAEYVRATTGMGLGDYARRGFEELVFAALLTLAVVAVAARRREPAVRALLGALCVLTLVMLASAYDRLLLVEEAFGFTRVRYAGHAVLLWLALTFALVLAAGASRAVATHAPRIAAAGTLAFVLAFSLSNPDLRVAQRATRGDVPVDDYYLETLSADALPALSGEPRTVVAGRLARPDALAGWNLSRARAR